ncbi:TetR/AcrR family transcriptional regulator [Nocardioides pakistanensis]
MATTTPGAARKSASASGSDRRAELLAIAARLFATRGFTQTTVRDIADEAGILSGSLYHHFSSKEAMLDEILRGFLGTLQERFVEIEREGDNPQQVLDALIRHAFATIHANPHAVALYQNEASLLSRLPDFGYVDELSRKNENVWIRVIKAGQKSGAFRSDVDATTTYRFIRDAVWSAVRWYRPGGKLKADSLAQQYLGILHGGLLTR